MIYIAEITLKDNTGANNTLYFSEKGFTIENRTYLGRISATAYVGQSISIDQTIGGIFSATVGEVVLQNVDRDLDFLTTYYPEGGLISLRLYDEGTPLSTANLVFTKFIEQFVFTKDNISIRVTDSITLLDAPLQKIKYLGTAIGPIGLEGASDLKDREKPLLFGRVSNIEPVLVNASKLVFQICHNTLDLISTVLTDGAYLTRASLDTSSLIGFLDDINVPPSGQYTFYSGAEGSFIRLGFLLSGSKITCSAQDKISPLDNTAGQVIKRILEYFNNPDISIEQLDITTLDNITANSVGIYINSSDTVSSIITTIVTSIGAYAGIDNNNKFRIYYFGDLTAPVLADIPNVTEFTKYGITSIEINNANYNGKSLPVNTVKLFYDRNYSVADKATLAGMVQEEYINRAEWLSTEYRTAIATGFSPVKGAQTLEYNTCLIGQVAAKYEVNRMVDLLSVKRYTLICTVTIPEIVLRTLTPCCLVKLQYARYNLSNDKIYVILGIETDYKLETATLTLWGPLFTNTESNEGETLYDSNGLPIITLG